jgi:O-methyltransferase
MGLRERVGVLAAAVRGDYAARYFLAERLAAQVHPEAILSDYEKEWLRDEDFRSTYTRFEPHNPRRMDRVWTAKQFARLTASVPGDTAECGAFRGLTSYVICEELRGTDKRHHVFDSFSGISSPGSLDGTYWQQGDLAADEAEIRRNLADFDFVDYHAGWIPDRFPDVADRRFSLVHIDVDLYEPTRDSLEFFWPRMSPNGVILMDDYGYATCPGARKAAQDLASRVNVPLLELSSGQGVLFAP